MAKRRAGGRGKVGGQRDSKEDDADSSRDRQKGRVVWNHSTHLPGLIPILERLADQPGVGTITPAVIGTTRSNCLVMQIKVSVPIRGGYKLIARKGKTFQEVFVLTSLSQVELEEAIALLL